jgi:hypothetical protein
VSITFVPPIIRAAIATLKEKLPNAIADFNAEAENTVKLAEPSDYVFGAMDPLLLTSGPVIEVASLTGRTVDWAIDRSEVDHNSELSLVVWHEGARGELSPTYEMSLGLARCVIESLRQTDAFGDGVEIANGEGSISWRADVLPEGLTEDGREFQKWRCPVLITFRLETVERF